MEKEAISIKMAKPASGSATGKMLVDPEPDPSRGSNTLSPQNRHNTFSYRHVADNLFILFCSLSH
jgi:hypothetical protein